MKYTMIALPCLLILVIGGLAAGQMTQTLPAGNLAGAGGAASSFPFNTAPDHKWHWHYGAAQFAMQSPIVISEVYVRTINQTPMPAYDFPSVELLMATSSTLYPVATHSTTFAANFSGDEQIVRAAAPWVRTTAAATSDWEPMGLDTPFLYDPTQGDFIFQIRKCGTNQTWGQSIFGSSGTVGANGGNRYGNTADCSAATSTFANNEFVPVIKIDYNPAGGLFASFTGAPTTGPPGLNVNFTDTSFTSDPNGIQTWGWDFGDGGSSSLQNPSHTYTCPGSYDVTLTVTDTLNPQSTITATGFVTVTGYEFGLSTTGGGVGDLTVTPVPTVSCGFLPGAVEGYTLITLAGPGAFFGLELDFMTITGILTPAAPDSPLHFLVSPGLYPDGGPLLYPAGTFAPLAGQTLSATQVTLGAGFTLLHQSNVSSATF